MSPYFGPTLEVSLAAITRNYGRLSGLLGSGRCGAVVKANAYGLGANKIAPALFEAGCRDFFVATLDEAIELRAVLDRDVEPRIMLEEISIYVFHGARAGQAKEFTHHRLIPVMNDLLQVELWNNAGPWVLHIDTGMCRLGIAPGEVGKIKDAKHLKLVMSHLACGSHPETPKNAEQLKLFREALTHFPGIPASFANSSGILLGADYHFDLARPGAALYGISRNKTCADPVENVVTLSAPVLQYRYLESDQTVGYGGIGKAEKGAVLATVELGYADGYQRILSCKGSGYVGEIETPIIGRVSMDMISVDVSKVPEQLRTPELRVTFIGKQQPVDKVAELAGTIGYEIFTRLGARVKRIYS